MSRTPLCLAALLAATSVAAPAAASTGGAAAPRRPVVRQIECSDGQIGRCPRGATLRLQGSSLRDAERVVFAGRPGHRERRVVRVDPQRDDELTVAVPATAHSGRVIAVGAGGSSSRKPRLVVLASDAASGQATAQAGVFPIRGPHDFGTFSKRFGGGRHHQGQDVLADCGLPVVAAVGGKVRRVAHQSAAGNYVVIDMPDGRSNIYMHLRRRATVDAGDEVAAGLVLGQVGRTGDATACHLHFEQWTSPGWYDGGHPIDPLPELRRWDAADAPSRP